MVPAVAMHLQELKVNEACNKSDEGTQPSVFDVCLSAALPITPTNRAVLSPISKWSASEPKLNIDNLWWQVDIRWSAICSRFLPGCLIHSVLWKCFLHNWSIYATTDANSSVLEMARIEHRWSRSTLGHLEATLCPRLNCVWSRCCYLMYHLHSWTSRLSMAHMRAAAYDDLN